MNSEGFDPKDLEEICSRKPQKYKMKKADFKELGHNVLLGTFDVALGSLKAVAVISSVSSKKRCQSDDLGYGYKDGNQGYGYYFGDIKDDD